MRRLWELVRLSLGSLRRSPLRVTLTATGVAIATGALVSMVGFALGVQARIEEPFQKMELLNRIAVSERQDAGGQPAASGTPPPAPRVLDENAVHEIAALSGVVLAYPEMHVDDIELEKDDHTQAVSATGLPPEAERLRFVREALLAGRFFGRDDPNEVILGNNLAIKLGFASPPEAVGSQLMLHVKGLTPGADRTFHFEERRIAVNVVGVWGPPTGRYGYSPEGIVMPVDTIKDLPGVHFESALQRLLHLPTAEERGYGRVVVRVERPGDLFNVEKKIQEMGFHTHTLIGQLEDVRKAFLVMDLVLTAVGGVALVVAGLGIINTQLMSVLERYREIGIYKALGASDGDVRLLFFGEAGLVGLLGGAGGLLLGRVVSWILEVVVNAIGRTKGIEEEIMAFAFPGHLLVGALVFALLVSLLSGVYPASRAARVDPIRALRAE
jgi:putative ABC transport system permease protein